MAAYKRDLRKGVHHPIDKPDIRICRECGISETEAKFAGMGNICEFCNKEYMKKYRQDNKEKIYSQIQKWKDENRDEYRESCRKYYNTPDGKSKHIARVEKTYRTWLSHLLSAIKLHAKKPGPHDPKSGQKRDFDIDLDYVCDVYKSQNGKCALTGIEMAHQFNDPKAASIDRIDSSKGHVKGNIQIICQCMNAAKKHFANDQILQILSEVQQHSKPPATIHPDDFTCTRCGGTVWDGKTDSGQLHCQKCGSPMFDE
jgi:hypothetical protein